MGYYRNWTWFPTGRRAFPGPTLLAFEHVDGRHERLSHSSLFAAGRPVADAVTGRLRWELRATWLGGMRVLDKVESLGYDTLARRPALTRTDAMIIAARAVAWR